MDRDPGRPSGHDPTLPRVPAGGGGGVAGDVVVGGSGDESAFDGGAVPLKAPYPWFGGKSSVAALVWSRFGTVRNFVDPFLGSLAMLLGRPMPFEGTETINDLDGFVANFWRAIRADPVAVARHADHPVFENDLHARHAWLVGEREGLTRRLEGDPEFFDARVAGWWCWGACCWIGSGWCAGRGPWRIVEDPSGLRQLVHLGNAGMGVNRKLVHLGNSGMGVNRKLVHLGNSGRGVNRKLVHLGNSGRGQGGQSQAGGDGSEGLLAWFEALSTRLRRVRVCSGDWTRAVTPSVTFRHGTTAVFLDPPYGSGSDCTADLYARDSSVVADAVREWALANGDNPRLRLALCGYDGQHDMPASWEAVVWKARGGYAKAGTDAYENCNRERLWFSPHCVKGTKKTPSKQPIFNWAEH